MAKVEITKKGNVLTGCNYNAMDIKIDDKPLSELLNNVAGIELVLNANEVPYLNIKILANPLNINVNANVTVEVEKPDGIQQSILEPKNKD